MSIIVTVIATTTSMRLKFFSFRIFFGVSCLVSLFACTTENTKPKPESLALKTIESKNFDSFTLAQKELTEIIKIQNQLALDVQTKKLKESEIQGRIAELEKRWATYMLENQNDITSLLIFGKFLRANEDSENAYIIFNKADKINPNIAVVKQQLATFEAESKDFSNAYEHILRACELEPKTAVYHYQLGELIYFAGSKIAQIKLISKETLENQMLEAFKTAASLDKSNDIFLTRYAQSYYDISNPDWNLALQAWDDVIKYAPNESVCENALLNKAQVAIEMSDLKAAKEFLSHISLQEFDAQRLQMQNLINSKEKILSETKSAKDSQNTNN